MDKLNSYEKEILKDVQREKYTAQVDEAGAGCFAGNLVVSAVILNPENPIKGLNDSKKLSHEKRILLFNEIKEKAIDYSIIIVSPKEIDKNNILKCRLNGMKKALEELKKVNLALIDGNKKPDNLKVKTYTIIKGDAKFEGIAAASILSKVTRDLQIIEDSLKYPEYGFENNKGYGTKQHKEALKVYGPCNIHRFSYKPVKESIKN
tara:strand:+ start:8859 stop:9476 length:618 start_codon:yes stop_codon:yes gene_type:complete